GVRCLPVGGLRGQVKAPPGDLGERRVVELTDAGLGGQEEVPQPSGAGLLLQFLDHWRDGMVLGAGVAPEPPRIQCYGAVVAVHELDEGLAEFEGAVGGAQIQGSHIGWGVEGDGTQCGHLSSHSVVAGGRGETWASDSPGTDDADARCRARPSSGATMSPTS